MTDILKRDGMCLKSRIIKALDPAGVSADERSTEDMIRLAQKYAQCLIYHDADNLENGDWSDFFNVDPKDAAAYLADPAKFSGVAGKELLARPHFVLLLAFLELLKYPRAKMDDFTRRHLDHYYKRILGIKERQAKPDTVHLLFQPTPDVPEYKIAKGTLLGAGTDKAGNELQYAVDREVVVNGAAVADTRSFFKQKKITRLRDIVNAKKFEDALHMVCGNPLPESPVKVPAETAADMENVFALYESVKAAVASNSVPRAEKTYIEEKLFFAGPGDFETFILVIKKERDPDQECDAVDMANAYSVLEKALARRTPLGIMELLKKIHITVNHDNEDQRFDKMFAFALGDGEFPRIDASLPVMPTDRIKENTAYELHKALTAADTPAATLPAIKRYIREKLFMGENDFKTIMETKASTPVNTDPVNKWGAVYKILANAHIKKRKISPAPPSTEKTEFIYPSMVKSATAARPTQRWKPFAKNPGITVSEPDNPGFAVTSPILSLSEGRRNIFLTIGCSGDGFDPAALKAACMGNDCLDVRLTGADSLIAPHDVKMKIGNFVVKKPLADFATDIFFICRGKAEIFQNDDGHIVFDDGFVYGIEFIAPKTAKLKPAGRVAGGRGGRIFKSLGLTGTHSVIGVTGPPDVTGEPFNVVLTAGAKFSQADAGKALVFPDGSICIIKTHIDDNNVQAGLWGGSDAFAFTPAAAGDVRKYDAIVFSAGRNIAPADRPVISTAVTDVDVFKPTDAGGSVTAKNGFLFRMDKYVNNREVDVTPAGSVDFHYDDANTLFAKASRGAVPLDKISFYSPDSICINALHFEIALKDDAPAPAPGTGDAHPSVLFRLRDNRGTNAGGPNAYTSDYDLFKNLKPERCFIRVIADNLLDMKLSAAGEVIDGKSAFTPFGDTPAVGSGLYFVNNEICSKPLERISMNIDWDGLPADFTAYYKLYADSGFATAPTNDGFNDGFKGRLRMQHKRRWTDVGAPVSLFKFDTAASKLSPTSRLDFIADKELPGRGAAPASTFEDPEDFDAYFKLELSGEDFQHSVYDRVLMHYETLFQKALQDQATATDAIPTDPPPVNPSDVNSPHTPVIKGISFSYAASEMIEVGNGKAAGAGVRLLDFFGKRSVDAQSPHLMPRYDDEGHLIMGVRDINPLQNISIFFRIMPVTAVSAAQTPEIKWSFLENDAWKPLPSENIIFDDTNGFTDTGIISFAIPATASPAASLLPGGMRWLRGAVARNGTSIPDMADIRAQAATATFVKEPGYTGDHLQSPLLPAGTIKEPASRDPNIESVLQPYPSVKGEPAENSEKFYLRVSERLRHKDRPLAAEDYERLVLERFPEIYKVKVLSALERPGAQGGAEVTVVVIPDISQTAPFFPLEPASPVSLLNEIRDFLKARVSPFINISVQNPVYEHIRYRFLIRFKQGYDTGYYMKVLNGDIKRFLSPWAYKKGADISFGSVIYNSSVIRFLEERPYTEYVTNFKLIEQTVSSGGGISTLGRDYAAVTRPDSIMVSAENHIIEPIATKYYSGVQFEGIGYMIIGTDFEVYLNEM